MNNFEKARISVVEHLTLAELLRELTKLSSYLPSDSVTNVVTTGWKPGCSCPVRLEVCKTFSGAYDSPDSHDDNDD